MPNDLTPTERSIWEHGWVWGFSLGVIGGILSILLLLILIKG